MTDQPTRPGYIIRVRPYGEDEFSIAAIVFERSLALFFALSMDNTSEGDLEIRVQPTDVFMMPVADDDERSPS